MKITQRSTETLKKYWKDGKIHRFSVPNDVLRELKKLSIIKYHETKAHYIIKREVYNKLVKGKQTKLVIQ